MKERQCNFEVLRIIAMLCIFCGHMVGSCNLVENSTGVNYWFFLIIGNLSRVGVNLFVFISCWFLSQSSFSSKHAVKTWFTAFFYGVVILLIAALAGTSAISVVDILNGISPVVVAPLWFVTVYFTFLFVYPAFQKILDYRNITKVILIVGFILICLQVTVLEPMNDNRFVALAWFCYVFMLIGYYRRYLSNISINKYLAILFSLFIYVACIYFMGNSGVESDIYNKCAFFMQEYKSIPNLLVSLGIFVFFSKIHIKYSKAIVFVSSSTLANYCIHCNSHLQEFLWYRAMHCDTWATKSYAVFVFGGAIAAIFLLIACIDSARRNAIEKHFLKLKPVISLCEHMDKYYSA